MRTEGSDQREPVTPLVRLLDRALRRLGDLGDREEACRVAADAWALLETMRPREAQRLNGTLHYLTRPPRYRVPPAAATPAHGCGGASHGPTCCTLTVR